METQFKNQLLEPVHETWQETLEQGLDGVDEEYADVLRCAPDYWLPGPEACLRAFSVPCAEVSVVWMGESPYPRRRSATGLAFEDGRANRMFGNDGYFSNGIDSSLRTILKAWFVATDRLAPDGTKEEQVIEMRKDGLVTNPADVFVRGKRNGWLWLNAAPGFFFTGHDGDKHQQVRYWCPVVEAALGALGDDVKIVLLGDLAQRYDEIVPTAIKGVHPAYRDGGQRFIRNAAIRALLREWRCLIEVAEDTPGGRRGGA